MKRYLWLLIPCLLVSTCAVEKRGDGIVLQVQRWGTIFPSYPTYIVGTDGLGPIDGRLPERLGDSPEWSPDGQWIVFHTSQYDNVLTERDNSAIYLMKSDGSQRRRITDREGYYYGPIWSPDGTRVAFEADHQIYILAIECLLRAEECDPEPMFLVEGSAPDWSPDGRRMVYESVDNDITVVNLDGTGKPVTLTPARNSSQGPSRTPQWSPGGERIVFSAYQVDHSDIFVMNADGSGITNLTNGSGSSSHPSWSPDGSKIVFVSTRDHSEEKLGWWEPVVPTSLYLMNSNGTHVVRISQRDDEHVLWYAWLPPASD